MKVSIIGSSSSGNLTYIEYNNTCILIDAGISKRDAKIRNPLINYDKVNAILLTHAHDDHIKRLDGWMNKSNINIYMSKHSLGVLTKRGYYFKHIIINENKPFEIGDMSILPLLLSHDMKCFGYFIMTKEKNLCYITDTGIFPYNYTTIVKDSDILLIEANHDIDMLYESERPFSLIQRIISDKGHLRNEQTLDAIESCISSRLKKIVFMHMSQECNTKDCIHNNIVLKSSFKGEFIFSDALKSTEVIEV